MREVHIPREICRKISEYLDCFSLCEVEQCDPLDLGRASLIAEEGHDELLRRLGQIPKNDGTYWCYTFCAICVGRNLRANPRYRANNKRKFL